jgi:methyl-accepting chemotaxis protein
MIRKPANKFVGSNQNGCSRIFVDSAVQNYGNEKMARNLRGRVYIDRHVQGALAKRVLLHWFMFFAAFAVAILAIQYLVGKPSMSLRELLVEAWHNHGILLVLMAAMLPSFVWDTIRFSNRFAGPIYRFKRSMSELAAGDNPEPMKFRDNDFWSELSEDFNRVAETVRNQKNAESKPENSQTV